MSSPTRSKMSSRLCPVIVRPWLRRPTTARDGIGCFPHEVGDRRRELHRPARIVDVRRDGAVDPAVYVQDRADLGMFAVDHPVLDRVDRHATRRDAGRHAQHHDVARRVVARVRAGCVRRSSRRSALSTPLALIQYTGSAGSGTPAHVAAGVARAHVAVRQAADPVEQLAPAGDRAAAGSPPAGRVRGAGRARRGRGPRAASGAVTASPSRSALGKVGDEVVADDEPRRRERFDPAEHVCDQLGVVEPGTDAVRALLERHEPDREARRSVAHEHREVREATHEERVPGSAQLVHVARAARAPRRWR